ELDLRNRDEAADGEADRDADDGRLGQGRVETPPFAKCFGQALGHTEHTTEFRDVLAEHQHAIVSRHRVVQCPVDRLNHRQVRGDRHRGEERRLMGVVAVTGRPLDDLSHHASFANSAISWSRWACKFGVMSAYTVSNSSPTSMSGVLM